MNNRSGKGSGLDVLWFIRLAHTIIWIVMFASVIFVFYCGVSGRVGVFTWFGIVLIFIEGLALLLGRGDCPLHLYAKKISGRDVVNDTFLPSWIFFKWYKTILSLIFIIGLIMVVKNYIQM